MPRSGGAGGLALRGALLAGSSLPARTALSRGGAARGRRSAHGFRAGLVGFARGLHSDSGGFEQGRREGAKSRLARAPASEGSGPHRSANASFAPSATNAPAKARRIQVSTRGREMT